MEELTRIGPEGTPENIPFALAPVANLQLVFAILMKRLATWAKFLTSFRSTTAPVASVCVSNDDEAVALGRVRHCFTDRISGHERRPIEPQLFPPRVPLLLSTAAEGAALSKQWPRQQGSTVRGADRVRYLMAEVAERVQIIWMGQVPTITHGGHVVLVQLAAI